MKRTIIGIGRICIDDHYKLCGVDSRIDSKKMSAMYIGSIIGGSVFSIIRCMDKKHFECIVYGSMPKDDMEASLLTQQLEKFAITHQTVSDELLPHSIVVHKNDNKLSFIVSILENEPDLFEFGNIRKEFICHNDVYCIICDMRQKQFACDIISYVRQKNDTIVFLDPGSSLIDDLKHNKEQFCNLIGQCDIICGSDSFFNVFDGLNDLQSIFHNPVFSRLKLAICTLSNGYCIVSTKDYSFAICRKERLTITGNTMGAGDVFKGWFLSTLLKSSIETVFLKQNVIHSVKIALAAALLKIQDANAFPDPPDYNNVYRVYTDMPYLIVNSSSANDFINK